MDYTKLRDTLIKYADRYENSDFIIGDPSWFMHQVTGDSNQETMAFLASALSYGSRKQFMPKIQSILDFSQGEVTQWVVDGTYQKIFSYNDTGCFYRLYDMRDMRMFLDSLRALLNENGSIGCFIRRVGADNGYAAVDAICRWFATHGFVSVVPKDTTSACKRICMFLRWMVRDHSPVDLGLWADFIDKRTLIMPLDTHVLTQACELGLMHSRCASMSAARKLTEKLAQVFPDDPLKGDFALFGYGVTH